MANILCHTSIASPDVLNGPMISIKNSIGIDSDLRPGVEYLKRARKQQTAQILKRLNSLLNTFKAYVVANTDYRRLKNTTPYYVILYTIEEDTIELVRITKFNTVSS